MANPNRSRYFKEYCEKYPRRRQATLEKYRAKKRAERDLMRANRVLEIREWCDSHPRATGTFCRLWKEQKLRNYREYNRKYRANNLEAVQEIERKYNEEHRVDRVRNQNKYYEKNREEIKAYNRFKGRVQRGKISKPDSCEVCGAEGKVFARNCSGWSVDFDSYVWMCSSCMGKSKRKD